MPGANVGPQQSPFDFDGTITLHPEEGSQRATWWKPEPAIEKKSPECLPEENVLPSLVHNNEMTVLPVENLLNERSF